MNGLNDCIAPTPGNFRTGVGQLTSSYESPKKGVDDADALQSCSGPQFADSASVFVAEMQGLS
jgi:hypothetical protein